MKINTVVATAGNQQSGDFLSLSGLIDFAAKNPGYWVEGNSLMRQTTVDKKTYDMIANQNKWEVSMESYFKPWENINDLD